MWLGRIEATMRLCREIGDGPHPMLLRSAATQLPPRTVLPHCCVFTLHIIACLTQVHLAFHSRLATTIATSRSATAALPVPHHAIEGCRALPSTTASFWSASKRVTTVTVIPVLVMRSLR
jgi:hypothetical protein